VASHRQTRVADAMPRSARATLLGDGRVLLLAGLAAGRQVVQPEILIPPNRLTLVTPRDRWATTTACSR
jgi:hypothetical protein